MDVIGFCLTTVKVLGSGLSGVCATSVMDATSDSRMVEIERIFIRLSLLLKYLLRKDTNKYCVKREYLSLSVRSTQYLRKQIRRKAPKIFSRAFRSYYRMYSLG